MTASLASSSPGSKGCVVPIVEYGSGFESGGRGEWRERL